MASFSNVSGGEGSRGNEAPSGSEGTLEQILAFVQDATGLDFHGYRRPIINRRVAGRMRKRHAVSHDDYLQLLRREPQEMDLLIQHLTIKVSRFYRNAEVFEMLGGRVLPELTERYPARPLRIWSAGCGNGEEAYSLMMLAHRANIRPPLLFATDIDAGALAIARAGSYPESALTEMPVELVQRYLIRDERSDAPGGVRYHVHPELREGLSFEEHDLVTATAPVGGELFDLICCRNVLIYLEQELVSRVQSFLTECVRPGGFLCLGEAEWLSPNVREWFEVVDRRARLFRRRDQRVGSSMLKQF